MNSNNFQIDSIYRVCRICLEEYAAMINMHQINNNYEMSAAEVLRNCLSLEVDEDDELPNLICMQCEAEVFQICEFKLKFDKSTRYLQEYLANLDSENISNDQTTIPNKDQASVLNRDIITVLNDDQIIELKRDLVTLLNGQITVINKNQINVLNDDQISELNKDQLSVLNTTNNENNVENVSDIENPVAIISDVDITVDDDVIQLVTESTNEDEIQQNEPQIKKIKATKTLKKSKSKELKYPYTCTKCNAIFHSRVKLRDHRRKLFHYTRRTTTCPQCKLHVPTQNYKFHTLKHSADLKCKFCDKKFSNNFNLKRHLLIHTNQTPYTCDLCDIGFSRQDKLKAHIMVHTSEKPVITCTTCGRQFADWDKLKQHQEQPVPCISRAELSDKYKRTLSCNICSKSFALKSSLITHKLLHTDDRVICSVCGKPYPTEKKLKEHKLQVHSKKDSQRKEFLCNICAKQYTSRAILQRHMLSHLGITKAYTCNICNKSFTQSGSLALHHKIHTGERPFVCHICSKAFNKPSNLQRHLRIHEDIRPYVCTICNKRFSVKHSLVIHTRIHTGEKPYTCSTCDKQFIDGGSLKKHIKTHSGQNKN